MGVPKKVREDVVAELYRRFDSLSWEQLGSREKTEAYRRFVADPKIGGALAPFMDEGGIRVWIKDGPAKEYRRALEGMGSYAQHTSRRYTGPSAIVTAALGEGWSVIGGSVEDKPMRCWAERDGERRYVVWGPEGSLKDLIWEATNHAANGSGHPVTVALTRPGLATIDGATWVRASKLADVVGCELCQVTHHVETKPNLLGG